MSLENRTQIPLTRPAFVRRVVNHVLLAASLLALSIVIGMAGYMRFEALPPVDAFLNTAMLLGGMGPVDPPHTWAGKLFAGLFALYAGLIFLVMAAVMATPLLHRMMHLFHWDQDER